MYRRTAVRVGDWKLLSNPGRGSGADWQLYDLAEDISESKDLAGSHPERLQQLKQVWDRLNAEMIDPLWTRRR